MKNLKVNKFKKNKKYKLATTLCTLALVTVMNPIVCYADEISIDVTEDDYITITLGQIEVSMTKEELADVLKNAKEKVIITIDSNGNTVEFDKNDLCLALADRTQDYKYSYDDMFNTSLHDTIWGFAAGAFVTANVAYVIVKKFC